MTDYYSDGETSFDFAAFMASSGKGAPPKENEADKKPEVSASKESVTG